MFCQGKAIAAIHWHKKIQCKVDDCAAPMLNKKMGDDFFFHHDIVSDSSIMSQINILDFVVSWCYSKCLSLTFLCLACRLFFAPIKYNCDLPHQLIFLVVTIPETA